MDILRDEQIRSISLIQVMTYNMFQFVAGAYAYCWDNNPLLFSV